ncbi:MAG: SDR family oxidoreductase [Endozoicomonas sp.]|uniref:SDR family oxidoreductase n=1 Tax=Endozoicomonas sp. TaxID=1892382 RepID=UPI003D9AC104
MSFASIFRQDLFHNKNIIVTGGGSGIGRCTAHELSALGAHVILVGRKLDKLEKVQREITEDGGSASTQACDIRDEEGVTALVSRVVSEKGAIHGLVNNAGGQFPSPLEHISKNGFEAVVRTNLIGGFLMAREVFKQSMQEHGGSVVNIIADNWGGMPGMGHSGAARAGMDNFTKTAAYEWGRSGVRVNAVAPGWIASSGMDTYDDTTKNMLSQLYQHVPLKRMGTESEVSAAICFLLSEAATFISGSTLRIDGAASQGNNSWPLPKAKNNEPFDGFHRSNPPEWVTEKYTDSNN